MAALLLLFLLLTTFLGTAALVRRMQDRIAMQSRLDICAVSLLQKRKNLFHEIAELNRFIRLTVYGVSVARGLTVVTGPVGRVFGGLSEKALVQLNRTLAQTQDARVALAVAVESMNAVCPSTAYSKGPAFCRAGPSLAGSFVRERTIFPDLRGAKRLKSSASRVSHVECRGGRMLTRIRLEGDPTLEKGSFQDRYEK